MEDIFEAYRRDPAWYPEACIRNLYTAVVGAGDTVIDGGSADGLHTRPLADLVGTDGVVLAVEPLFSSVYKHRAWVGNYAGDNIIVCESALGKSLGHAALNVPPDPGYSSLGRGYWPEGSDITAIQVQVTTIDHEVAERGLRSPRFIKLDLEGGEVDALTGAMTVLDAGRPIVVFEHSRSTAPAAFGYSPSFPFELAHSLGYEVYDILGREYADEDEFDDLTSHYLVLAKDDRIGLPSTLEVLRTSARAAATRSSSI